MKQIKSSQYFKYVDREKIFGRRFRELPSAARQCRTEVISHPRVVSLKPETALSGNGLLPHYRAGAFTDASKAGVYANKSGTTEDIFRLLF